jgi:hypothetical protein
VTEERPKARVGDQVYDACAGKEGVVTDVQGGAYILRELNSCAFTWKAPNDEKLTVTVARLEQLKRHMEGS